MKGPNRKLKITFLCLTLAFILFAGAGAIGFRALFRIYDGKIPIIANNHKPIDLAALPTPNAELFSEALSKDTDYYETGEIVEVPIYEQKKIDRFITSMVIVIQNGSIKSEEKQTDMIFLASYNQLLQKFTVVSVARDTIVPLSEDEWARISAAYARGGVGLLINTLNDLFGLDLQNYVVTGTDVCDTVGTNHTLTDSGEKEYQTGSNTKAKQQQTTLTCLSNQFAAQHEESYEAVQTLRSRHGSQNHVLARFFFVLFECTFCRIGSDSGSVGRAYTCETEQQTQTEVT